MATTASEEPVSRGRSGESGRLVVLWGPMVLRTLGLYAPPVSGILMEKGVVSFVAKPRSPFDD